MTVSLNQGKATIDFSPANTVTMKQLEDALSKNGFTTKESQVVVEGQVEMQHGLPVLHVSGSNEEYKLTPASGASLAPGIVGKNITVSGVVAVTAMGKVPTEIRFNSVAESK